MAGKGRGVASFTFNIDALGIGRGSMPDARVAPSPLFPVSLHYTNTHTHTHTVSVSWWRRMQPLLNPDNWEMMDGWLAILHFVQYDI